MPQRALILGAARYRDYIKAVNYLIAQNKVAEYFKENKNIILAESLMRTW